MPDIIKKRTSTARPDGEYKLPPVPDSIQCPVCGEGTIKLNRIIYHLPDGDDIVILTMECPQCGFRRNDMIPLASAFKPGKFVLTVDDGDLDHKIFRGMSGNIDIPEVGVSIERGPAASFMINNLEGLLTIMKDQVEYFLSQTPPQDKEWIHAHEALKRVQNCLSGKMIFTLILEDIHGGSYIVPTKPEKMKFIPIDPKSAANIDSN